MAGLAQTSGNYSVFVTGGNANVGYKARMNFYGGQRRGYSTRLSTRATTRITGPGQELKDIPSSVLGEVVMCLNNPSPLRNNWKAVAAELSLNFQTVQSLDHHGPGGKMNGVLEIMFQRKMTVRNLADMLEKIQRPDIVDTLIKAGLPKSNIQCEDANDNGNSDDLCSNDDLQVVTIETPVVTHHITSSANNGNGSEQTYSQKQYNQLTKDSLQAQSTIEGPNITSTCGVPSAFKLTDVQGQLGNPIICEEFVSGSHHGALNCSIVHIKSLDEESKEVVAIEDNSARRSIIDTIARFILASYSGLCGRLRFRAY